MKRLLLLLALLAPLCAEGQKIPKLKPISEKHLQEKLHPAEKKGKWGFANEKDNLLVKAVFDAVEDYQTVVTDTKDTVYLAKVLFEGKWALLNRDGTFLVEPRFDELFDFKHANAVFVCGDQFGVVDHHGWILADGYQDIENYSSYGTAWFQKDGSWGILDQDGMEAIPNMFTSSKTEQLVNGLVRAQGSAGVGLISLREKKMILSPDCESINLDSTCGKLVVYKRNGLYGCVGEMGEVICRPEYEYLTSQKKMDYDRIIVKRGGLYGLMSSAGEMVITNGLATNQFKEPRDLYQLFGRDNKRNEVPYVYYKERLYTVESLDDYLFKNLKHSQYVDGVKDFPYWMKRHLPEALSRDAFVKSFSDRDVFIPMADGKKHETALPLQLENKNETYTGNGYGYSVRLDKDLSVWSCTGFQYNHNDESITLSLEGMTYNCGSWISQLSRSVDSDKIRAFDDTYYTDLLNSWSSMLFRVPYFCKLPDGKALLLVDMYIDSYLLQRSVLVITANGSPLFTLSENGILYDPEYGLTDSEDSAYLVGDILIRACYDRQEQPVTIIYSLKGKRIDTLNRFIPTAAVVIDKAFYCAGTGDGYPYVCYVPASGTNSSMLGIPFDPKTESVRVIKDQLFTFDNKTGLAKCSAFRDRPWSPSPVLRYVIDDWDGRKVVGLSKNYWDAFQQGRVNGVHWECIPRVSTGYYEFTLENLQIRVYPANPQGIAVYSVMDTSDGRGRKYGYIGLDEDFFTGPVFDEAKDMEGDKAPVRLGEEWKTLSRAELKAYTNGGKPLGSGSLIHKLAGSGSEFSDEIYEIEDDEDFFS